MIKANNIMVASNNLEHTDGKEDEKMNPSVLIYSLLGLSAVSLCSIITYKALRKITFDSFLENINKYVDKRMSQISDDRDFVRGKCSIKLDGNNPQDIVTTMDFYVSKNRNSNDWRTTRTEQRTKITKFKKDKDTQDKLEKVKLEGMSFDIEPPK